MYEWKVTYHYVSRSKESMVVSGWKPILQLVRDAQQSHDVIRVDVGPKIGPESVTFVMIDKFTIRA